MKPHPKIIDRIIAEIDRHESFCIVGHIRPDGDCVGSQIGLALALIGQGKKVTVWNQDPLPPKYAFLDPDNILQTPKPGCKFDCVIATDAANFDRLGSAAECLQDRKQLINIDHHDSNTRYGDINWVSGREPSSGELIFKLLNAAGWPITKRIADCLFTAVSTDTGSFQYPNTTPGTYHVAGELVRKGANLSTICHEVYQSYPLSRARLLKHIYSHFRLTDSNRIAYFWLRQADFEEAGAVTDETEGLIDHIRAIEPVIVACVFEEIAPGQTRISLRSKSDKINVSDIAGQFGGGGHRAAAGAKVTGSQLSTQRRVLSAIKKALKAVY